MEEIFTRTSCDFQGIGGHIKLARGAICKLDNGQVFAPDGTICCMLNSENGKNFCTNNKETIKCLDLIDEIFLLDLKNKKDKSWLNYGSNSPWGWQWNAEILDWTSDKLENLLSMIKGGCPSEC